MCGAAKLGYRLHQAVLLACKAAERLEGIALKRINWSEDDGGTLDARKLAQP